MKLIYALISIIILITGCKSQDVNSRTPASVSNQCKGDPAPSKDPKAMLKWLSANNKNKIMEEIICCLPDSFKKNYKIVHSSFSAQQSHYKSPRLLFGFFPDDGIFFSISGGDKNLPQSNSIEVLLDNKEKGEIELFDIEIGMKGKHLSQKNPELCISCHGSRGEVKAGGPRPIMNDFPWPRMATFGGFRTANPPPTKCKERNQFFDKMVNQSKKVIKKSPRFRCLSWDTGEQLADFRMDGQLKGLNMRRVLKEIERTPDFKAIQPFLLGVDNGCFDLQKDFSRPNHTGKTHVGLLFGQPTSWFKGNLKSQLQKDTGLSRKQKKKYQAKNFKKNIDEATQKYRRRFNNEENLFRKMSRQLDQGKMISMPSGTGLQVCRGPEFDKKMVANAPSTASFSSLYKDSFGNHLRRDLIQRVQRGLGPEKGPGGIVHDARMSLLKWIFEARGIDTSEWSMAINTEFRPPDLKFILRPALKRPSYMTSFFEVLPKTFDRKKYFKMCRELKKHSLAGGFPDDEPDGNKGTVQ